MGRSEAVNEALVEGRRSITTILACISALSGILAPLLFVAAMLVVQSRNPGYSPIRETISTLAVGEYGWLQTMAFFLFGSLLSVFTFRLYATTERRGSSRIGATALVLSGMSFFPLGLFPAVSDSLGGELRGLLHTISAMGVSSFYIIGCSVFAAYFRKDRLWRKFSLFTAGTAVVSSVFLVLWVAGPAEWQLKGLSERLLLLSGFLWLEIVSFRLLRACLKNKCRLSFSTDAEQAKL